MIRPLPEMKQRCEQVAEALSAESSREHLFNVLSAYGLHAVEPQKPSQEEARATDEGDIRVGIWRLKIEDGEKWFVREKSEPPRLWADVERIHPKGTRKRVVLLGESAARGYFYDPRFSFAAALRASLEFAGVQDVEIIDLARTDTVLPRLTQLMRESLALEPDVLVVFAGNNWQLTLDPPNFSLKEFAAILTRGGGAPEIEAHCADILRGLANTFIKTAVEITTERRVPVLFALPEFNLGDWHNEKPNQTPFRSSEETTSWEAAHAAASQALEDGAINVAEEMARRMIDLDSGTTPAGYEFLAQCALRRSCLAEARRWLERAKDAGLFLPVARSPRCYGIVQETLRREAEPNGIALVDLPNVFTQYLSGEIPDRRLFLDYCHLSIDGMRVAAAAVIERLLPILGKATRPWTEMTEVKFDVSAQVLAEALFKASIHNAHWGQDSGTAKFQCQKALELHPEIADVMLRFVDASLRRAPSFICASSEKFARDASYQSAAALHLFNSLPPIKKNFNLILMHALISVLAPVSPTLNEIADRLLISEFCVGNGPCDLLQRAYSSTSLEDWDWLNSTIFYRARESQSNFKVICCRRLPLGLKLTGRAARFAAGGQTIVKVNGTVVGSFQLSSKWENFEIESPAYVLAEGLNTLSIQWPAQNFTREDRTRSIGLDLALGRIPTVPFVYAELSRFTAVARLEDGRSACEHPPVFWPDVERQLFGQESIENGSQLWHSFGSGEQERPAADMTKAAPEASFQRCL